MTSDLLKCTICPKKPRFSDASHLLTHVGSKGHLAHLHGLQVRSHQEIDAGQQLAAYNQWFEEHGVAALLSERMRQKEQKQADKKAANRRRMSAALNVAKPQGQKTFKKARDPSDRPVHTARTSMVAVWQDSVRRDDIETLPVRDARYAAVTSDSRNEADTGSTYPDIVSSPSSMHFQSLDEDEDLADPIETDVDNPGKASLGSPKLKGTHWPGMALFDAASEELRRKRNQRKDGSVLEKLEYNATVVQPRETVHSATGTVLKHRHMDDLEDDSPVEGEETLVQPSPKKRKIGGPRARRQPNSKTGERKARLPKDQHGTSNKIPPPSMTSLSRSDSPFSPAESRREDFKFSICRPVRKQNMKGKQKAFTVYEDSSPPFGIDGSSESIQSAHVNDNAAPPQFAFSQMPYFRHPLEPYDPFKSTRGRLPVSLSGIADFGTGKENAEIPFIGGTFSHPNRTMVNPLCFGLDRGRTGLDDWYASGNQVNPITTSDNGPLGTNSSFLPIRNPLMLAMDHLDEDDAVDAVYGFDDSTTQIRQPLFAP